MFTSAQQNEPRYRKNSLGIPSERVSKRLLNRRNSYKNRRSSEHYLKICIWTRKVWKSEDFEDSWKSKNVCFGKVDDSRSLSKCESGMASAIQNRAAIYVTVYLTKNQKSIISNQLQVCRRFILPEGWTCSYLHIERKAHEPIESLARSRGSVGQFDLIVSFLEFFPYGQESVYEIGGMISVSNAENFAKGYS